MLSIAYGKPVPAIDGNVLRVLSRVLENPTEISDLSYRAFLREELKKAYPKEGADCSDFTKTLNKQFFNEFVIEVENADKVLSQLKQNGITGGLKLDNNKILVAATEMNTEEDINAYVKNI